MDIANNQLLKILQQFFVYRPPDNANRFVLDEHNEEAAQVNIKETYGLEEKLRQYNDLLRYGQRLLTYMQKVQVILKNGSVLARIVECKHELEGLSSQYAQLAPINLVYDNSFTEFESQYISNSLEENLLIVQKLYHFPENKDIVIRRFSIADKVPVQCAIIYIDGMTDKMAVNQWILQPLMQKQSAEKLREGQFVDRIAEDFLPTGQTEIINNFDKVQIAIDSGDAVLFFEGAQEAITAETKGREHRTVGRPYLEQSTLGNQEGFTNVLRINTALIRTTIHTRDLITEVFTVGNRNKIQCAVMYFQLIANPQLIEEVKRRITNLRHDYIGDINVFGHFIEDHPINPFPVGLSTERPDRVANYLTEGRIALVLDGSSLVYILPVSIFTLLHSAEDLSLKLPFAIFSRVLRFMGVFITCLLPALYLAISTFHQEALPTDMLLAIASAREQVPFPTIVELILMEFSFELIREGVLRIPGMLGPTIGVVGAIILGQAIVQAKIVSPIAVIIVALTGLASFTIPDYRLGIAVRVTRFAFLFLSGLLGLVGIATGLLIIFAILANMKSFGVPYLAPMTPNLSSSGGAVMMSAVYKQPARPDELNTKDKIRQPRISRQWLIEPSVGSDKK